MLSLLVFLLPVQGQKVKYPWAEGPGSDLSETGEVLRVADWSESCDSWKTGTPMDVDNDELWKDGDWTCPKEKRSPSGCGDFEMDTRELTCDEKLKPEECGDGRWVFGSHPILNQYHACNMYEIEFDRLNSVEGKNAPLVIGRHRERWPKYGEYEYLPAQRYLHATEHGAVVFAYHQCLDEESICKIRQYIKDIQNGRLRHVDYRFPGYKGEVPSSDEPMPFRFIMTPYKDLRLPFAMFAGTAAWYSKCYNPLGMDIFLKDRYRHGWEDYPPSGAYDYLWRDFETVEGCTLKDDEGGPVRCRTFKTAEECRSHKKCEAVVKKGIFKKCI